ncbi:hypothetical protein KDJ56_16585 [Brevibacillus composti]|uniref:Uncharacterized protein n=1 Tax=Brevibacillus composti TaxID=2796470 RepID=A0A7T5EIZ5_9BACL|nr:hypothetical protein [Brevibacillus composti]QQE73506.1 hypothetical protein JD108_16640 [Brevibacillus composti]QUO40588.1 hypothetical protein KDJ56_16585 [Brevibacillus composti]
MEFIADGWALIKDGDSILFNKLGEYGEDLGYYRFNFKNIVEVSKTEYFKIKYGSAYEHVVKLFGDNITDSEFAPDGSLYVSFFQSSNIHHFDVHGVLLRTFEDPFNTVYDIALDGNSIWCAYPTAHTIKNILC